MDSAQNILFYPHQLFLNFELLKQSPQNIFLLEDPLFFQDAQYPIRTHIQRMVFHRVSLQNFSTELILQGHRVKHILFDGKATHATFINQLQKAKVKKLALPDPCDQILLKRLRAQLKEAQITLTLLPSPGFLNTEKEVTDFFSGRKTYSQTSFYIEQRKRRGILLDLEGKPRGGKWSFDPENRKKLPKGHHPPGISSPTDLDTEKLRQAYQDITKQLPLAIGIDEFSTQDFIYPTTHKGAESALQLFLEERFQGFGDYEDALHTEYLYIYHSLLSPLLNSGLLTPQQVLEQALDYAENNNVGLNAVEGFVRQIIGWREYMCALYSIEGVHIRNQNFWNHTHKMPEVFYTGTTGIEPVDHVIHNLKKTGYAHHIERLMVLGNFMCLCEIAPESVYEWFMEFFIDAYDWVMVPNVYSMSQYADGGLLTTKPYISSSNYLRKMSNYPKGEWCDIWDGLYWRFIHKHRSFFEKNPRLRMMTRILDRMSEEKRQKHLKNANDYLKTLHGKKEPI